MRRWAEAEDGAFLPLSFWLAECHAQAGRLDRAHDIFAQAAGTANDLGLLAEEVDLATGEPLGNMPQALSHVGLVNAAQTLTQVRATRRARLRGGGERERRGRSPAGRPASAARPRAPSPAAATASRCWPASRGGWTPPAPKPCRWEPSARSPARATSATPPRSWPPPSASRPSSARSTSGSTTRWSRHFARARDRSRRLQAGDGGHVPRSRARRARRAAVHASSRSRGDRHGWLGAGLPRHPAAGDVLLGQARRPGVRRFAALRAHARRQRRARDDRPPAGPQHDRSSAG